MGTAVGGKPRAGGGPCDSGQSWPAVMAVLAGQPCDGYLQADGHTLGPRDYEEHMYVNTQSLDTWEPEAHGAAEESPKKDLFDMSKSLRWGKWCRTCCGVVKLCQQLSLGHPPQPWRCWHWVNPQQCTGDCELGSVHTPALPQPHNPCTPQDHSRMP